MKTISSLLKSILSIPILSLFVILIVASACNRNHKDDENVRPVQAEVMISDITADKCLNLQKLATQLQNPQFNVPAAILTTNLNPLSEISRAKTVYFSYSSFYYKVTKANDLNLFTSAHQSDCQTIQLLTASNEVLTYNITDHSENQMTFVLTDTYQENIPEYEKKVIEDRLEPYEYTLTYISTREIKVVEKFRSLDPLCDTKNFLKFEITKNITWADSEDQLPKQYQVDPFYLGAVQQALVVSSTDPVVVVPPVDPNLPLRSPTDTITVDDIIKIMQTPIRDELKLCS